MIYNVRKWSALSENTLVCELQIKTKASDFLFEIVFIEIDEYLLKITRTITIS